MKQQSIEYTDRQDKLIGQLIYNDNDQKMENRPTVIVFPAFEGLGEFAINYGHRLAEKGYVAFVADVYGEGKTADTIEDCMQLITPFLNDRALVRRRATLAFDTAVQLAPVNQNNIASIGFCFGGLCALELARAGTSIKATVTAHGVLQASDLPTEKMLGKFLILHGFKDPQVPPTELTGFAKEMEAAHVDDWTFIFFGNAMHSFTDIKTGTFDPAKEAQMGRAYHEIAAHRSFRYAIDLFNEVFS